MNIKKGLFRSWIVLSLFWVMTTTIIFSENFFSKYEQEKKAKIGDPLKYVLIQERMIPVHSAKIASKDGTFILLGRYTSDEDISNIINRFNSNCMENAHFRGVWTDNVFILSDLITPSEIENLPIKCGSFIRLGDAYTQAKLFDWRANIRTLSIILMPSCALLIMGLLAFWIIAGFKSNDIRS